MSKKILAIIILFIIAIPLVLFLVAAKPTHKQSSETSTPLSSINEETKKQKPQTTLAFFPNPLTIASESGSIDITIDTGINPVTAVQLDLSYDPATISAIDIATGTFFPDAVAFLKNIDTNTGKISYVLAIPPTGKAKTGVGTVATLNFTTNLATGRKTQIKFTKKTLVTAEQIQISALKTTENATIISAGQ